MIVFQDDPDAIFLAIVDEALAHTREVHLVRYQERYRPTRAERRELEAAYRDLFPELVPLFTRGELVRVIDRLRRASRDERRRYELTDYHWLVLYACLQLYGDLHNDGVTGDQVGPYEIERIDVGAIVDRFFFDTDFLLGTTLLSAEEAAPGYLGVTRQASKIAARLRPEAKDLRMRAVVSTGENEGSGASARRIPASGYVGPYPLREREAGGEEDE